MEKPPENLVNPEATNITPEQVNLDMEEIEKRIFDKVIDINQTGIGFTGITVNKEATQWNGKRFVTDRTKFVPIREIAKSIFSSGLLGSRGLFPFENEDSNMSFGEKKKQEWVNSRKKGRGGNLFVNIVERDINEVANAWVTGLGSENEEI